MREKDNEMYMGIFITVKSHFSDNPEPGQ